MGTQLSGGYSCHNGTSEGLSWRATSFGDPRQWTRNIVFHPPHALFLAPLFLIFAVAGGALAIIPYWFIFRKAGFSPWLSLWPSFPGWFVVLYVVAFSRIGV